MPIFTKRISPEGTQTKWIKKLIRHFENERGAFKKKRKKKGQLLKKKENTIIAVRKDISLKSVNRLRLIMRKSTILKRNENERLKKSFY
jgi:hypothetical protein